MKIIYHLTVICFLTSMRCYSQDFIVANALNNVVWVGFPNLLSAAAFGCPCKSIILSASNGKIKKDGCTFVYVPDSVGPTKIIVRQQLKNKTRKIGEVYFRAKPVPDPIATVAGLKGGPLTGKLIVAQGGVIARSEQEPFDCSDYAIIRVDSFTTVITRNHAIVFSHAGTGPHYDDQVKTALSTLQAGDTLSFLDIVCRLPNGSRRLARPIEFSIIDTPGKE